MCLKSLGLKGFMAGSLRIGGDLIRLYRVKIKQTHRSYESPNHESWVKGAF